MPNKHNTAVRHKIPKMQFKINNWSDTIAVEVRLKWQEETGYGRRALVETTMGQYKAIIGPQLRARSLSGQRTEAMMGCSCLTACCTLDAQNPFAARKKMHKQQG